MYMGVIPIWAFYEFIDYGAPHVYGGDPITRQKRCTK